MNRLVTVYYNDVFVSVTNDEELYEVYADCPYVNLPIEDAERIADDNVDNGDWDAYLIPELIKDRKIMYHI